MPQDSGVYDNQVAKQRSNNSSSPPHRLVPSPNVNGSNAIAIERQNRTAHRRPMREASAPQPPQYERRPTF
ncbi:MAG: hypothetical protein ABI954_06050 [Pyrinomonadaceae bacterium]